MTRVVQEIERKFLVPGPIPADLVIDRETPMRQGYLVIDEVRALSVRIRAEGPVHRLAIKHGRGIRRTEVERELTADEFEALWPATISSLEKRRLEVRSGRHTLEVDVFEGALAGLVMVEVEFGGEQDARSFSPPTWFGREVTDDPRYLNQTLSREGLPAD